MPLLHTNGHAAYRMASSVFDWIFPRPLNPRSLSIRWGKKTTCRSVLVAFYEDKADAWNDCSIAFGPWLTQIRILKISLQLPSTEIPNRCTRGWKPHSTVSTDPTLFRFLSIIISLISLLWRSRPGDRDYYAPVSPWMRGVHWPFTIPYSPANYSGVLLARDGLVLRLFLPGSNGLFF